MIDLAKLQRFEDKPYRDGYLQTHIRSGIAYQINALREQSGLTQTEFASLIGKPQSVVSRLENTEYGRVTVQTLLDVASALDVALLVRFVSYPEFLERTADMSPAALRTDTVRDSIGRLGLGGPLRIVTSQGGLPALSHFGLGERVPTDQPHLHTISAADQDNLHSDTAQRQFIRTERLAA